MPPETPLDELPLLNALVPARHVGNYDMLSRSPSHSCVLIDSLLPGARIVRAFNAISAARMGAAHEQKSERVGMPIAGDDASAIELASRLIREIGYEPVLIGGLAMGKHLMPGTPLAGERTPDQVRQIAATLK